LVVVETLGKRWTFISAIDLISSQFEGFEVRRMTHNTTIVRRYSADGVYIAELLRSPRIAASLVHM
jgi:hypothetical protein